MLGKIKQWTKFFLIIIGSFSTIMMVIAFTSLPYNMQVWLGTKNSDYKFSPNFIVFLGGSGMPSGDNFVRLYYTALLAKKYPHAKILVAHPLDDAVIHLMKQDLIIKGVDSTRIIFEKNGTSTREQALKAYDQLSTFNEKNIVLITSPEYMYRSVSSFKKAGFKNTGGEAAFENAMFVNLKYDNNRVGGKLYLPDVSDNIALRYNFWNYLKLEITCIREWLAIAYYKLNGWV